MSVDPSHKGRSVTIQLCRGILGWLAPLPWQTATPPLRHKRVGLLEEGGRQGALAGLSWDRKAPNR